MSEPRSLLLGRFVNIAKVLYRESIGLCRGGERVTQDCIIKDKGLLLKELPARALK
jgi:hypothetical protein